MTDGICDDSDLCFLFFNARYLELVDLPEETIKFRGSQRSNSTHAERGIMGMVK